MRSPEKEKRAREREAQREGNRGAEDVPLGGITKTLHTRRSQPVVAYPPSVADSETRAEVEVK